MNLTIDSSVQNIIFNGQDVQKLVYNGTEVWSKTPAIDYSKEYLTAECLSSGSIYIKYTYRGGASSSRNTIYYSKNGGEWTKLTWPSSPVNYVYTLSIYNLVAGDKIRFKCTPSYSWYYYNSSTYYRYVNFDFGANVNLYGNINSMNYGDNFTTATNMKYSMRSFFSNAGTSTSGTAMNKIISAENLYLPDLTMYDEQYYCLFANNTGLTTPPKNLLSSTLVSNCYGYMFSGCTALTKAPSMVINTAASSCCFAMFRDCSNLEDTSEIVLYTPAGASSCYGQMFMNCSKVNTVKCFLTSPSSSYTSSWLSGASSTGTFYKLASASWSRDVNGIPSGWSIVNI